MSGLEKQFQTATIPSTQLRDNPRTTTTHLRIEGSEPNDAVRLTHLAIVFRESGIGIVEMTEDVIYPTYLALPTSP